MPDDTIFTETTVYDYAVLKRRLREMAFLTKGLRIILRDSRQEEAAQAAFGDSIVSADKAAEHAQIGELLNRAEEDKALQATEESTIETKTDDSAQNEDISVKLSTKITENARCRKSFAFSQRSCATFFALGRR